MGWIELDAGHNRTLETANFGRSGGTLHPDRVTNYHDIVYMESGSWEVWEETTTFTLKPGDVLFLFQGRHHFGKQLCTRGARWMYLHFPRRPQDRFMSHAALRSSAEKPESMRVGLPSHITSAGPQVEQLVREIVHGFWSSLQHRRQLARVLLSQLLIELSRLSQPAASAQDVTLERYGGGWKRSPIAPSPSTIWRLRPA